MKPRPSLRVLGAVLAAGASSRLGRPKQLLPYRGTTLLAWSVAQAEACRALDDVVVVLGEAAEEIRASLSLDRARLVLAPPTEAGCAASYRAALEVAGPETGALVILLGEQPEVPPQVVEAVVQAWRAGAGPVVLASYQGRRGHPLLFDRVLFPQLQALHGDKAAWRLVDAHPDWVHEVPFDRPYPRGVNTWEDYQALLAGA